jgi:hypothetical protein
LLASQPARLKHATMAPVSLLMWRLRVETICDVAAIDDRDPLDLMSLEGFIHFSMRFGVHIFPASFHVYYSLGVVGCYCFSNYRIFCIDTNFSSCF